MTDADLLPTPSEPVMVDIEAIERQRFAKPAHARAASAITAEDLAFEAELQSLNQSEMPAAVEQVAVPTIKPERTGSRLLSSEMPEIQPAKTLAELDNQVFLATSSDCDAIEADEKIIRYFTRNTYPEQQGYFMYKGVRVFIPGRFATTENTDKGNMYTKVYRIPDKAAVK
jgi:hypothetical protein